MKKMILCALLLLMAGITEAQTTQRKHSVKKQSAAKGMVQQQKDGISELSNTSTYEAKGNEVISPNHIATVPLSNNTAGQSFQITDPILRTFNESAARGASSRLEMKEVLGIRRAPYGIANGHITFLPGGARTTGANTGSGAVGTGSSPGVIGADGRAMGLNGKNPYSGPGIYGTSQVGISSQTKSEIKPPSRQQK
ncbi:MAG: hypothetical protein ICV79_18080 [Flavisolibacter sp.]|nr:hypothetical protein [Flavisolibacter sp.]